MRNFYQRLTILLLIVFFISGIVIYFTVDINTLRNLNELKPWSLMVTLVLLLSGLYFDGTRLMHLVRISGENISLFQAIQVVFGNYFLAMLTPGAAGGAFAQVMFLRRAGIPTGKATVLVAVRTILSILFLLVCMPFVFYFDPGLLPWIPPNVLAGSSTVLIIAIGVTIALIRTRFPNFIIVLLTKRLHYTRRRKIFSFYRDIRGALLLLSTAPLSMLRVFTESAISLLLLYGMVPIIFLGMGSSSVDWILVMGRMIFLNILLYFAPTPGGSGVAEGGFVVLLNQFAAAGTIGIAAVVWRFFAEYLPFAVGLYFTVKIFGKDFINKQMR